MANRTKKVARKAGRKPAGKVAARKPAAKAASRRPAAGRTKAKVAARAAKAPARAAAPRPPKGVPPGFGTVSPYLVVRNGAEAIEFYKKAFGAKLIESHRGPDGHSVMYALLDIGGSMVQLCDEWPQMEDWVSPAKIGGTTVALHLYVPDCDAWFQRAVAAGATVKMPMADQFWGDRYGWVLDPYGHAWSIATQKRNLSEAEIDKAAAEFFASLPQGCGETQG